MNKFSGASLLILLSGTAAILRLFFLDIAPPGIHVDEAAPAVAAWCPSLAGNWASTGFFYSECCSVLSGLYIYLLELWLNVLNLSVYSVRLFSALWSIVALAGIWVLALELGGSRVALCALLSASLSPWLLQYGRLAWSPALVPALTIWGLVFLIRTPSAIRTIIGALLLAGATLSYRPQLLQIPLIVVLILVSSQFIKERSSKGIFIGVYFLGCMPQLADLLIGQSSERISFLLTATAESRSLLDIAQRLLLIVPAFIVNFYPPYLFLEGDYNPRHSSEYVGQLSWLDFAAILAFLFVNSRGVSIRSRFASIVANARSRQLILGGILFGILPGALTIENIPHAGRTLGAAPFYAIFSGFILAYYIEKRPQFEKLVAAISAIFLPYFWITYISLYPSYANEAFHADVSAAAITAKQHNAWKDFDDHYSGYPISLRAMYFATYGGFNCDEAILFFRNSQGKRPNGTR